MLAHFIIYYIHILALYTPHSSFELVHATIRESECNEINVKLQYGLKK